MTTKESEEFFERHGTEKLNTSWFGDGFPLPINIEQLYQAFKVRLLNEVVAIKTKQNNPLITTVQELPLKERKEQ